MAINGAAFISLVEKYMHLGSSAVVQNRRIRAVFGSPPTVAQVIWVLIKHELKSGAKRVYLLWALNFLKNYSTEYNNCVIFHCDEKTFRHWSWEVVYLIATVHYIKWSNRLHDVPFKLAGSDVYVSVDGTDCPIMEPHPFSTSWFSQKSNGPGVRYEIGLSVRAGRIVWVNGPFRCESYTDYKIFINDIKKALQADEKVFADRGYTDVKCIRLDLQTDGDVHRPARAQHETVNESFKIFIVVHHVFRHDLSKHYACFHAVAKLTAIILDNTNALFDS